MRSAGNPIPESEPMSEIPVDQRRNPQTLRRLNIIAANIFHRYGVDFAGARRAGG